jgi:peptide/nickel transport system ATP-binding protein
MGFGNNKRLEQNKKTLLTVDGLSIGFEKKDKMNKVVDNVSFQIKQGEILGIVGESGSGKTMTALTIMGLLSNDAKILSGDILFLGTSLLNIKQEQLRRLKGKEIAMIFQEPMTSLNPVMTIGYQIEEMLILHEISLKPSERKNKVFEALVAAGLKNVETLYDKYPHQLSGGMRQRVMIAMAMICKPKLLIADEPTTALDVTIQGKILKLIMEISENFGTTVILISHDLGVIKNICQRALVMQGGKIVEEGLVGDLFHNPKEEYTKKLIDSMPGIKRIQKDYESEVITNAKVISLSNGLNLQENESNESICLSLNPMNQGGRVEELENILEIHNLTVSYDEKQRKLFSRKIDKIVVDNVSLQLQKGEILGIVGESGSGKSTLAKAITGLIPYKSGDILLQDAKPQMVFQDPYGSLNPVKKVGWILEEPLRLMGGMDKVARNKKVIQILEEIGLGGYINRYLNQLSGGQRQRVAIGVALIQNSKLIVLDEPVSALDVTVQKQILILLKRLKQEFDLSYIFISHDLNVVYEICDRVCVMYQGQIVERGLVSELYERPEHPYTKQLLQAIL